MHICLVSVEIFAWGKYGGFGRATRVIGRELVKRGLNITAIVPRRKEQSPVENLDGMRVLSFRPYDLLTAARLYRRVDVDLFHSEEPSFGSYLALRSAPAKSHMVTFRDTRDPEDWRTEFSLPSLNRVQVLLNRLYEDNFLVHRAMREMDAWYAAANLLIPKAKKRYDLPADPIFLPTPVSIPEEIQKADRPTVSFVSRWDRRKRPELFFRMVERFPDVHFIAAGYSRDPGYDDYLRSRFGHLANLDMMGFVDQFRDDSFFGILEKSWIVVNTAAREALPNNFLEACAHKCALLSAVDPDGFASRFGYHAAQDDFQEGLETLLYGDTWQECGERGQAHVQRVFGMDTAIDQHIEAYEQLL